MRNYPRNSPQAAARIVALAVLADGHLAKAELDVLERLDARYRLGLECPAAFRDAIHALCEELLGTADPHRGGACRVDRRTLAMLMAEIEDPGLRATVLELCTAAIEADAHVADGEALIVTAALEHWQQPRDAKRRQGGEPRMANA